MRYAICLCVVTVFGCLFGQDVYADVNSVTIVVPQTSSTAESLAAKEVRRYLFLRTGKLLPIVRSNGELPANTDLIVIGQKDRDIIDTLIGKNADLRVSVADLLSQQYRLKSLDFNKQKAILITGGDAAGTLYCTYRFIEQFGVRFYLHGDIIPDAKVALKLPEPDEHGKPLFNLRGIQPFHDFPEGPDWWNINDYKAILTQLPKLRMNFIGLHTYPEGSVGPEATVWIGLPEDVGSDGTVTYSYPSSYHNVLRNTFGYSVKKTGEFNFGGAGLFESDDYGPDVMAGMMPWPKTPEENNKVFNNVGQMLKEAFEYAHSLGIKTCAGTEIPLTIPKQLQEHLKSKGLDPASPQTIKMLYKGMFKRIYHGYPLDYYWFWTPEGWTWDGAPDEQVEKAKADLLLAVEAAEELEPDFILATCGWVLGPPKDRLLFNTILPKEMPFSCINRQVGKDFVEPQFAGLGKRPRWAIPWLEDDPSMIAPQLWAGRMRKDAADALKYGCTGLMGIHWRTRNVGPTVSALSQAAWDQGPWNKSQEKSQTAVTESKPQRNLPTDDFYNDWALYQFGPEAACQIAGIFIKIDGNLPEPATWLEGPGGIVSNPEPWNKISQSYAFVDELAKLEPLIKGAGNYARYEYWLKTFQYMRAMAQTGCTLGELDKIMKLISEEPHSQQKKTLADNIALPLREQLVLQWGQMVTLLLEVVSTNGELGTVSNIEQHCMEKLQLLNKYDKTLEEIRGEALPAATRPWSDYRGLDRIIVPTVRTSLMEGEDIKLKVIILAKNAPQKAMKHISPLQRRQ